MGDAALPADLLRADLAIEYPFNRTTGPVIGAFFTGLRERVLVGIRGADGRVICPPVEYDPVTSAPLTELVKVGDEGTITSWSWVPSPRASQALAEPHALAMIRLDGADTALLHVVAADGPEAVATGARVRAHWADEREGGVTDIAYFELTGEHEGTEA
ncbi:MAG TPA: OB-fold domain-containing protein [Microthrixaceae bacterium]|nr:OB-fold domain-containing protein [Microthrixaceae bacterium]HNI36075.1 OB-fold domain-containing protein [Microthrixaceae bacterium]